MTDTVVPVDTWVAVCHLDDLAVDRGACVLVDGRQVALFRLSPDDRVHAISNYDPFSAAFVLSRGIVGSRGGVPKVASPMYKQSFDLRTGECLDDPSVAVDVFLVRCGADGRIEVRSP
jgi:nitrite reductase (NADH) small subunit